MLPKAAKTDRELLAPSVPWCWCRLTLARVPREEAKEETSFLHWKNNINGPGCLVTAASHA